MSFDELPPNPPEETVPGAGGEASSQDAPPARPTRRRRTQAAGTDAASALDPSADGNPTRPTRRRRVATETSEAPVETSSSEETVGESSEPAPATRPARRRTSRTPKPQPTESVPEASLPVEEPAAQSDAETSEKKPRRRTRKQVVEAVEPSAPAETVAETPAAEEAPARPSGRRTRSRKPAPETTLATPVVSDSAETDVPAETSDEAGTEVKDEPRSGRNSRRRGGRSRRPSTSSETPASESVSTPEGAETPEASSEETGGEGEETESGTSRRSRRRRGGRGKRSGSRTEPVIETEAVAVEAEEIVEAVAAPVAALEEEHEERVDRNVGAHLVSRHGCPEIHINGVTYPPVLFFGNLDGEKNRERVLAEVRKAARAGVHLHSTLIELPCPLTENSQALDVIDDRLRAILEADPEGFVMPRIVFLPARGWKREYPSEIAAYADGTSGDPSITSGRFWEEAERSLVAMIGHLREYEWGKRVFGYHLEHGEWFQSATMGPDRSVANRDAFRDWLREKYKNSLTALRAAWYDADVQFHTAEIPAPLQKPNPQRAFFEPRRERCHIDFAEFTSESTARRIIGLARAIKKATSFQALVSVCYGYAFEFGHGANGHLALGLLESAQAINLICGPPSYRDRKPGGAASFPAPVDSLPLHGKLWLSEDDTKTDLAPVQQDPEDFNPRLNDRFATDQAHARSMGRALSTSTAVGFMDLWGEGWLNDESLWDRIETFAERYRSFLKAREHARVPQVVALIDERSLLHIQRGEPFFRKLTEGLRDVLQRAGISYGTYLQSDLLAKDFPTDAKLYLFLTPYRISSEQRNAIREKLQNGGKTLAWLYAPGSCEERPSVGGMMEETSTGTIGFSLRQQAWNSEIGSRILDPHHIVTRRLPSREFGVRERLNPSFYVDDNDATTLAEYQGSGLPSLAVKDCGTWKSVFVGEPTLPLELLRGICRYAGVHVWTSQGDDVTSIGNGWITVHAAKEGQRTLYLPEPIGVYDTFEGKLVSNNSLEYRFYLRAGMTRTFFVGSLERMARVGFTNLGQPTQVRERLPLEEPPMRRDNDDLPAPLRADLETLEAVLTVDLSALENLPADDLDMDSLIEEEIGPAAAEPTSGGEVIASGRRRRRGGRGRGRSRLGRFGAHGDAVADGGSGNSSGSSEGVSPFPTPDNDPE